MRCAQLPSEAAATHRLKPEFNYNTGSSVPFLHPFTDEDVSSLELKA